MGRADFRTDGYERLIDLGNLPTISSEVGPENELHSLQYEICTFE